MKSWISHSEYGKGHRLAWFDDEDGEGGRLGEVGPFVLSAIKPTTTRADRELITANATAAETEGVRKDGEGFYWETHAQAARALKAIRYALKHLEMPMPEWAIKAKAAGWVPPKGWKP